MPRPVGCDGSFGRRFRSSGPEIDGRSPTRTSVDRWRQARARLAGTVAVGYIGDHEASISACGWVYAIEGSVPEWIDQSGALHSGGWPVCIGSVGTSKLIRFASVSVTAAGDSWHQVVMVDCRS